MTEKKIESFLDAVYSAAEAKSKKMIREIDRAGETALREYKAELRRSADADRRRERARAARISAETAAHDETEIRRTLLRRREAIADEVFTLVQERLEKYRATPEYKESLFRSARDASEMLAGKSGAVLLISAADSEYAAELESAVGLLVKTDISIKLGGLRGVSSEVECDCTLDAGLDAARADFLKESGLSVV